MSTVKRRQELGWSVEEDGRRVPKNADNVSYLSLYLQLCGSVKTRGGRAGGMDQWASGPWLGGANGRGVRGNSAYRPASLEGCDISNATKYRPSPARTRQKSNKISKKKKPTKFFNKSRIKINRDNCSFFLSSSIISSICSWSWCSIVPDCNVLCDYIEDICCIVFNLYF